MTATTTDPPADDLAGLPQLLGLTGQARFVSRTDVDGVDTVLTLVGGIDDEGRWQPDPVPVRRLRERSDRTAVLAGPSAVSNAERTVLTLAGQPPFDVPAWELGWLTTHRSWLAERAATAERTGLPDRALVLAVRAWAQLPADLPLTDLLAGIRELAGIDGSLAWLAVSTVLGQACAADQIDPAGPSTVFTGSPAMPMSGAGSLVDGRLSGHWRRVPGVLEADWLMLPVRTGDRPAGLADAMVRLPISAALVQAGPGQAGLRGAADHDVLVTNLPVQPGQSVPLAGVQRGPLATVGFATLRSALLAAACSGLASALVSGIVELARTKVRSGTAEPLLCDPAIVADLAAAAVEIPALTDALLCSVAGCELPASAEQAATVLATGHQLATRARQHAERAFRPVGASALFEASPMQRSLRDLMTISRHLAADPELIRAASSTLLGSPLPHPDLVRPSGPTTRATEGVS